MNCDCAGGTTCSRNGSSRDLFWTHYKEVQCWIFIKVTLITQVAWECNAEVDVKSSTRSSWDCESLLKNIVQRLVMKCMSHCRKSHNCQSACKSKKVSSMFGEQYRVTSLLTLNTCSRLGVWSEVIITTREHKLRTFVGEGKMNYNIETFTVHMIPNLYSMCHNLSCCNTTSF